MASAAVAKAMVTRPAEVCLSTPACPNCWSGWVHKNCTAYTTVGSAADVAQADEPHSAHHPAAACAHSLHSLLSQYTMYNNHYTKCTP